MDFLFPVPTLLLITLIHMIGAALQGAVGYGMALISGPILVLIDPRLMPGPYLVSSMVLSIFILLRERRDLVLGSLGWAIAGRVPGSFLAAALLAVLSERTVSISFGVVILLGVILSLSGLRFKANRFNLFTAGILSGVMGTIAAIGGPPIALVYQHEPGGRLRTNMSIFFLFGTLISIVSLAPVGKFGLNEILLSLNLIPAVVVGFFLSSWLVRHLNPRWTRAVVLGVAAVSAVAVLARQLG
jgi:hypothetical protein